MKTYFLHALIFLALTAPAMAQEMPAPRKMPREPVSRQEVVGAGHSKAAIPASREVQGQAIVVDTERLHIGDFDLRLFGIVPPQLSASFGPQARAALDQLTAGQTTTCTVRDRDREGRFLATCHNAENTDLALELLKRGLAVAARGSVAETDLAAGYIAAEQAAESQKTGLWSVTAPVAASVPETAKPPLINQTVTSSTAPVPAPTHPKPAEEKPIEIAAKPEPKQTTPVESAPVKASTSVTAVKETAVKEEKTAASEEPGFLARYQLLITGLVMLATALGMLGAIAIQRMLDRRTEMKAIAAALRGELMAARSICFGRLKTSAEMEEKDIAWPRIRSTLYQAYVGRLGWLGAELARRVASIYGQASDYASYYDGSDEGRGGAIPKRQALQMVISRIDEILPRLAIIEHTGSAARSESGLAKPVAETEQTAPPSPAAPTENRQTATTSVRLPVGRLWTRVRDLARTPWPQKKANASPDPIAEYTALIEEEMKRFAYEESEDTAAETSDVSITRIHGTSA